MRKNEYPVLFFSNKLYYKLLKVYPVKHRQRFRDEMAQVFRNLCRDIYSRQGLTGLMGLWFINFFDLLKTALEERLKEVSHMTKEKFIRLSGWALMLGGVTFILGFGLGGGETSFDDPLGGPDAIYEYGQLVLVPVAMLFFTIGMLGLRSRYGGQVGRFGSVSLAIGAIGGGIGLVGAIGLFAADGDGWWIALMLGILLLLVGLLLFGIAAIRKTPLPRWNGLPLLLGSIILLLPIMGVTTGSDVVSGPILASIFFRIAAGFVALGYVVQGDSGEETSME